MRTIIFSLLILFTAFSAAAQRKNEVTLQKIGVIDPTKKTEEWNVHVQNLESPSPDGNSFRAELQRRKLLLEKKYPRKNIVTAKKRQSSTQPVPGFMFEGNSAGNSTPNDNTMAISNDGILVSSINSNVYFYDVVNDTLLGQLNLNTFAINGGFNTTNSKYDPKALYDPEQDRFILTFLNGSSPLSSKILVAFSSSNNPLDPWNLYALIGNPLNNNRWSDYPAIEVNASDFFCTINLIVPGEPWQTGFEQSLIWNLDKTEGYNGVSSITSIFWDSLYYEGKKIRNIHPVRNAQGKYSDTSYFLSNRNFSPECDSIFLITLTGGVSDANQNLTIELLRSDQAYFVAVDALQPQGHKLATNDSRVLGASIEKNRIQFVQNSTDTLTGNCSVYHGMINLDNMTCTGFHIASDTLDFGYPNMASTAIVPGEQEVMITFEYSSANDAPGFGVVYFNGTEYSPFTVLRTGENYINVLSDTLERWGDYSGCQRKYNEPCRIWASGTFGKTTTDNGTWIAEVSASDTCRTYTSPNPEPDFVEGMIYPNPSADQFTFDFYLEGSMELTIELYNVLGQRVRVLYEDVVNAGENRLTFNTTYLAAGNYILQIRSGNTKLITKKIIVIGN